ncbi:hypothetical protein, partial [Roseibium sp. RKSG952]|uniref:hypothetical protein n=1 Tax=Roseibium sp. RKSG952 TaxID=2529384 RepID=UPI0018AD0F6C
SSELKDKRAELTARAEELATEMAETQAHLVALDKVIAIYDPDWKPEKANTRRVRNAPKSKNAEELDTLLGSLNRRQTALETLRILGKPSTTAECTQLFADRLGILEGDPKIALLTDVVTKVLCGLERLERVRSSLLGDRHRKFWEIAN